MNRNKLLIQILSSIREDMHELCKKFPLEAGFCFGVVSLLVIVTVGQISGVPGVDDLFVALAYLSFGFFIVRFLVAVARTVVDWRKKCNQSNS